MRSSRGGLVDRSNIGVSLALILKDLRRLLRHSIHIPTRILDAGILRIEGWNLRLHLCSKAFGQAYGVGARIIWFWFVEKERG